MQSLNPKKPHLCEFSNIESKNDNYVITNCWKIVLLIDQCFKKHIKEKQGNWNQNALEDLVLLDTLRYRLYWIQYSTMLDFAAFQRIAKVISQIKFYLQSGEESVNCRGIFSNSFERMNHLGSIKDEVLEFRASELSDMRIPLHCHNFIINSISDLDFDLLLAMAREVQNCITQHAADFRTAPIGLKPILAKEMKTDLVLLAKAMEKIETFSLAAIEEYKHFIKNLNNNMAVIKTAHIQCNNQA